MTSEQLWIELETVRGINWATQIEGMEGWRKVMGEECAVTGTLLMMYRWHVSVPSPHQ